MTESERNNIIASVKRAATELVQASLRGDAKSVLRCYSPTATVVEQGVISPSFEAVSTEVRAFYETNRVTENEGEEMRVEPLSNDVAVLTGRFRFSATDARGAQQRVRGAWTAVYAWRQGEWKVMVSHQSAPTE